ncbi:MAG: hypothetical protein JKY67_05325 [Pseudomonadales bacterium]|nr:hypothetical protein [Pseudomonadales bacterium]
MAKKAISLAPNFHQPKIIVAAILREKGNPASALQYIADIDVSSWDVENAADHYNELGKNHDLLGETSQSFQCFSTANQLQAQFFDPDGARRKRYRAQLEPIMTDLSEVVESMGYFQDSKPNCIASVHIVGVSISMLKKL